MAGQVVAKLHLDETAQSFLASYKSSALSGQVLSITLSAATPTDAQVRAAALAQTFLAFRADQYSAESEVIIAELQRQVNGLQGDIARLTSSINGPRPRIRHPGQRGPRQLVSERTNDEGQVSTLQADIEQDRLNTASIVQGSSVLDPATVTVKSAKKNHDKGWPVRLGCRARPGNRKRALRSGGVAKATPARRDDRSARCPGRAERRQVQEAAGWHVGSGAERP